MPRLLHPSKPHQSFLTVVCFWFLVGIKADEQEQNSSAEGCLLFGCVVLGLNLTFGGQQDFNEEEDTNEGICMEILRY